MHTNSIMHIQLLHTHTVYIHLLICYQLFHTYIHHYHAESPKLWPESAEFVYGYPHKKEATSFIYRRETTSAGKRTSSYIHTYIYTYIHTYIHK